MPLIHSKSKEARQINVEREISAGKPPRQAVAIAYQVQREAKAAGGGIPMTGVPYTGLVNSPSAGRTDKIPLSVPGGSYVIPADVVSALGQGNSLAGAMGLHRSLKMHRPRVTKPHLHFARGGKTDIMASGGEFIVPPEIVHELGGGDLDRGHDILDHMVKHVRRQNIGTLKRLPGPKS
ncbi:MAG: hypothetical protein KGL39_06380 [Patescibacteria group bacterium]|nr:hypothetical protein [Patescibacteria group bacterium]